MTECSRKAKQGIANLLRARFPYIYIPTWEEERAVEMIRQTVSDETMIRTVRKMYQWSQASGFVDEEGKKIPATAAPAQAIDFICKSSENAVFILKDFHVYFGVGHRPGGLRSDPPPAGYSSGFEVRGFHEKCDFHFSQPEYTG